MEARVVAQKLLFLSQDPKNQPFFIKGGVLQGLCASLLHADSEVALISTRTLQFLSSHPQNKKPMREFPKLVENLIQCATSPTDAQMKKFAAEALDNLGVAVKDENAAHNHTSIPFSSIPTPSSSAPLVQVELFVDGLRDSDVCVTVQRVLLRLPGVISVSFDKNLGLVYASTRGEHCKPDLLADALRTQANISCRLPYTQDGDSGYLNESDFHEEENAENNPKTQTMAQWTGGPESCLEARLREEQRQQEELVQTERIISKVGTALTSAGSWLMGW